MMVIGLTGPTGAGKTTALTALRRLGFEVVDCDALYHEMLRSDRTLRERLQDAFGQDIFLPDGGLDRKGLAARVFRDPKELDKLNGIVYPLVGDAVAARIRKCSARGLAIDAINLLESGLDRLCDKTIAVTAPTELRVRRIMARDGITEQYARLRISAQPQFNNLG